MDLNLTGLTRSPKLLKGALLAYDDVEDYKKGGYTHRVVFQYNPESMTRTLDYPGAAGGKSKGPTRLKGPPVETFTFEIELDATDFLEHPDKYKSAVEMGIYPQLAAFEMMLYPKKKSVLDNARLLSRGSLEIIPQEKPFILFHWGSKRVLPIRLTSYSVTEEAYDVNLNPIRAKVSLRLQVLTYSDFSKDHPGYNLFMAYQSEKENMAKSSNTIDFGYIGGGK